MGWEYRKNVHAVTTDPVLMVSTIDHYIAEVVLACWIDREASGLDLIESPVNEGVRRTVTNCNNWAIKKSPEFVSPIAQRCVLAPKCALANI